MKAAYIVTIARFTKPWTICCDTLCEGYQPIIEYIGRAHSYPVEFESEAEAQAEIDSDKKFYVDCFPCLKAEIGHKAIFTG